MLIGKKIQVTKTSVALMVSLVPSTGAKKNRENMHWLRIHFADVWTLFCKMLFDQFWPHLSCLLKKAENTNEELWLETDNTYLVAWLRAASI